ncbi:MAG: mechanosensitive ion channel [Burkholderiaceae bacterium]
MTVARLLPWVLGTAMIIIALWHTGLVPQSGQALTITIWLWLLVILAVDAVATSIFLADLPGWQLLATDRPRRALVRALMVITAAVIAFDGVIRAIAPLARATREFSLMQSAIAALSLAALMFMLTRLSTWRAPADDSRPVEDDSAGEALPDPGADEERGGEHGWISWRSLRVLAVFTVIAIILGTLAGQVAFGYFVATRAFYLAGLVAAGWCLRSVVQEILITIDERMLRSRQHAGNGPDSLLTFYFGLAADVLLLMLLLPPAFIVLGADPSDVENFVRDAMAGFQIGSVRLSVADMLSALGVFLAVLALTWLVQRILDRRMFPHMRVDIGVRHSFRTLIGYFGILIAVVGAVGALGFNLSNLAIVAGALSVGIGFGLQSIVNNFVSGLILLFERPIKIGDWIVTSAGEGYVRRISVRSTEIETFDRASIIVPNSELVGSAVTNRTHGNNIGRISVPIGVSYDEDPRRVIEILREIVRDNRDVMRYPEPLIYFADRGQLARFRDPRLPARHQRRSAGAHGPAPGGVRAPARGSIQIPYPHRVVQIVRSGQEGRHPGQPMNPTPWKSVDR